MKGEACETTRQQKTVAVRNKKKKKGGGVEREVGDRGVGGMERALFSVEREPAMFFHSLEGLLKCVSET